LRLGININSVGAKLLKARQRVWISMKNVPTTTKSNTAPVHLLVVEDDETDRHLITLALQSCPRVNTISYAEDGVAALAVLDQLETMPALAFIDLHMPRMNGYRLLQELEARPGAKFPVIVLTSASEHSDIVRGILGPSVRIITKPSTLSEMTETLQKVIAAL
jgi:CheY-like chemotaxis protein